MMKKFVTTSAPTPFHPQQCMNLLSSPSSSTTSMNRLSSSFLASKNARQSCLNRTCRNSSLVSIAAYIQHQQHPITTTITTMPNNNELLVCQGRRYYSTDTTTEVEDSDIPSSSSSSSSSSRRKVPSSVSPHHRGEEEEEENHHYSHSPSSSSTVHHHHEVGTGRFSLSYKCPNSNDHVCCMCTVSNRELRQLPHQEEGEGEQMMRTSSPFTKINPSDTMRAGRRQQHRDAMKKKKKKLGRLTSAPLHDEADSLPVQFSVILHRTASVGVPLTTTFHCSTIAGTLSVDGVSFQPKSQSQQEMLMDGERRYDDDEQSLSSLLDALQQEHHDAARSMTNASAQFDSYQGPALNQHHLAEVVVNVRGMLNPLSPYRQLNNNQFVNHIDVDHCQWSKFNHLPVHTIPPATLYQRIVEFLRVRGVDDSLALKMHQYAFDVQRVEDREWCASVMRRIGRHQRHSPVQRIQPPILSLPRGRQ